MVNQIKSHSILYHWYLRIASNLISHMAIERDTKKQRYTPCCLTTQSPYLGTEYLNSILGDITGNAQATTCILYDEFENYTFKITATYHSDQWVIMTQLLMTWLLVSPGHPQPWWALWYNIPQIWVNTGGSNNSLVPSPGPVMTTLNSLI